MATYTPDAYNANRPVSSDIYQTPEELRALKQRITDENAANVKYGKEFQKTNPASAPGITATGEVQINLDTGLFQRFNIVGNTTFSIQPPQNVPADATVYFTLALYNAGGHTITWPTGSKFQSGTLPILSLNGLDILVVFQEYVNGPWIISHAIRDVKVPP